VSTTESKPRSIPAEWLPRPEDELLHEPFGDESFPWKETFFISIRDDEINANIVMHMTVSANRSPDTRCAIGVSQGAQSLSTVVREDGVHDDRRIGNSAARLEIVNLSWDSRHELRWVGSLPEVEFDLTLKGKHWAPLWDTMHHGFYATGKTGQVYCHTEQVITAEGTMRWKDGGQELPFSGFGWRDRGWGRRKTQLMWTSGWDLVSAILPDDSVFSFIALRSHEIPEPAPMPVAGWYADAETLTPLVGGEYHKEATTWPRHIALDFEDGHRVVGDLVRPTGSAAVAMQESEVSPDSPNMATAMRDYYAIMRDPQGREFSMFTQNGWVHKIDVFRDAQFIHAGNAPRLS
jgi:hypothetical protein